MSQLHYIHPDNPQARSIDAAVSTLGQNGIILMATNSGYELVAQASAQNASKIQQILKQCKQVADFSIIIDNLSTAAEVAEVDNNQHRVLKGLSVGAFSFYLTSSKTGKKILPDKPDALWLRFAQINVLKNLLQAIETPLLIACPVHDIGGETAQNFDDLWESGLAKQVDLGLKTTDDPPHFVQLTQLDLSTAFPILLQAGDGDASKFI